MIRRRPERRKGTGGLLGGQELTQPAAAATQLGRGQQASLGPDESAFPRSFGPSASGTEPAISRNMTLPRLFTQAVLVATLSFGALGGCAAGGSAEEDGSASAWAAVEAGDCSPDCTGRTCGLDPICGVSCGACSTGESCDEAVGQCAPVCVPDCSGRTCGLDPVCGVSCGTCGSGSSCNDDTGACEATSNGHSCKGHRYDRRHRHHGRH
jgi:hypothetical protein